jgi:hypothetical protein
MYGGIYNDYAVLFIDAMLDMVFFHGSAKIS